MLHVFLFRIASKHSRGWLSLYLSKHFPWFFFSSLGKYWQMKLYKGNVSAPVTPELFLSKECERVAAVIVNDDKNKWWTLSAVRFYSKVCAKTNEVKDFKNTHKKSDNRFNPYTYIPPMEFVSSILDLFKYLLWRSGQPI